MPSTARRSRLLACLTSRAARWALGLGLAGWVLSAQALFFFGIPTGTYIPQSYYKFGAVYTRAIVPGPNGRPVYVEYGVDGKEAREIGEAIGQYERARVMAAGSYRSLLQRLRDSQERYPDQVVMKAEDYKGQSFKTAGGEAITKPTLAPDTLTAVVRPEKQRFLKDGSDLLLLELPIDTNNQPSASSTSMLLSDKGEILHQATNTIGFRVGFFGQDGKVADTTRRNVGKDTIYGALPDVGVTMGDYVTGGRAITDENGKYRMHFFLPPCPGFTFDYTTPIYLELYYKRFNPRTKAFMPYYMTRPGYDFCNGLSVYSIETMAIVATIATPVKMPDDFPIDLMVLDGGATLKGAELGAKTSYSGETSDYKKQLQEKYDFDGDEKPDWVVPGKKVKKIPEGETTEREVFVTTAVDQAELQGIYLSSRYQSVPADTEKTAPDFTRLIDTAPDFKDRGLLKTISKEDLRDTDIYVFRESNGQLVAERRGLHEKELYKNYSGVEEETGSFRYTIHLRGSVENYYTTNYTNRGEAGFQKWQSEGGFKEEFQRRTANHLKAGETVRIIAINRPTGYMGSVRVPLQAATASGNFLNFASQQLVLSPPNLKIWAERKNKVEQGMTKGETRKQLIGNEGAGLGSDVSIAIYTDWRDQDGGPLPEELGDYGYTGRLAKIVAENQLAPSGVNNLSQFKIKPGQQVQVITLPERVLAKQHLYLQVAGQPDNRNPEFSSGGGEGILQYRPTHFVPVQVPLHDEEASEIARQAYRKADKAQPELNLKKPEPIYAWKYRPEMQFSLYELKVAEIRRIDTKDVSTSIINDAKPQIDGSNKYVEVIYDLVKSAFGTLGTWSYQGERELILVFGEEEVKAKIDSAQNIKFENINHLGGLSPDDFLSLRLYANNDKANILWEFAFGSDLLGQIPYKYVSVDSRSVELVSYLPIQSDENNPKNVKVNWSVSGAGSLSSPITDSKYGIFHNTLTVSTVAGTHHTVTAKVVASDDERVVVGTELTFEPFTVVPGSPKRIELSSASPQLLSSGVDKTKITGKIYDQFNNPVEEGSPVAWESGYSGQLEKIETAVKEGGIVTADYVAGLETLPTEIVLSAGDKNSTVTIEKKALDYTIALSSTHFSPGQSGTVTVTLNQAPEKAIDVFWNNTSGLIFGPERIEGTSVQAQFRIDDEMSSDGHVAVNIGGVIKDLSYSIAPANPEGSITFDFASIASGAASTYTVETLEGSISQPVVQSTNATVYGRPNTTVTLSAGGFFTQNFEPVALFPLSGLDVDGEGNSVSIDTIGGLKAKVDGDVSWDETESYFKPGSSMKFSGGRLLVTDNDALDYNTDYFANIRFSSSSMQSGAILLRKGSNESNGYELRIVEVEGTARLQARVSTEQGDFTVVSSTVIEVGTWYLAGLQLKNGILTLGVNAGRDTVAAPGEPNNSGFANNLIIGEGFQGHINDLKIGQIHPARGSLVLIDGQAEKEVTFDQDGKARVSITGGTAKLNNLGSRVGFTIKVDGGVAQVEEKELRYRTVISRFTLLGNPVGRAYAESIQQASENEGGVAVVDGQAMAEAIEMLKKAGKPALDALKTATQFLFEMTSISDVWQLTKAVYLWTNGRFNEVDKIELAFAGIGVTLTVVTVAVSVGSGGTGAPGSIAAMISVKGALKVLKSTLKEVFKREPAQLLRIGGTAARWSFDLVAKILGGREGRQEAIKQLTDFKDVFIELISSGSAAAWGLLKNIGHSADGFVAFLNVRKIRKVPCSIAINETKQDYLYARFTPLNLSIQSAHAASLCGIQLSDKLVEVATTAGLSNAQKRLLSDIAVKATRAGGSMLGGLKMSTGTIDSLADMVKKGQGESLLKFVDNMDDINLPYMGGFRFDKMNLPVRNGDTAFDVLIDAMNALPLTPVATYEKAFKQLAAANHSNIRGMYGEAATFKRLKDNPQLVRDDGGVINIDPAGLKVGANVNTPLATNVQGVDIEGLVVDRFFQGVTSTGGPLFVEVKNYTSAYPKKSLQAQTTKHFGSNIKSKIDSNTGGWVDGKKPHLHYEWMGEGFTSPTMVANRKKWVIEICEAEMKAVNRILNPKFDCAKDITFKVVSELIDPLTVKPQ